MKKRQRPSGSRTAGALQDRASSALSTSRSAAAHLDRMLDEALQETFPASDPISTLTPDTPPRDHTTKP